MEFKTTPLLQRLSVLMMLLGIAVSAGAETREFSLQETSLKGELFVAKQDGKYYIMGKTQVEEGFEAKEITIDDEGYITIDMSDYMVLYNDRYTDADNTQLLVIKDGKLEVAEPTEDIVKNTYIYCAQTWDSSLASVQFGVDYSRLYCFYGKDSSNDTVYDIVLKTTSGGKLYFGLQDFDSDTGHIYYGASFYMQCAHANKVKHEATAATCTEPNTLFYCYCPDCEADFADEKCHKIIEEYHTETALGHHYENGSTVCTRCGENASIYRPITSSKYINDGGKYLVVGHIGSQYYVLSNPTKHVNTYTYGDDTYTETEYSWGGKQLTAIPVTLNDDGSITAADDNILELCMYAPFMGVGSTYFSLYTYWGSYGINSYPYCEQGWRRYKNKEVAHIADGVEFLWYQLDLVDAGFKLFESDRNYDVSSLEVPDNIKNMTFEQNDVTLSRTPMCEYDNVASFVLAQDNGSIYMSTLMDMYSPDRADNSESINTTATLYPTTLYYCASKAMAHMDSETSELSMYGDDVDKEDIEDAIDDAKEAGLTVSNLDLSGAMTCNLTHEEIHEIVDCNPDVLSQNTLTILPSGSTVEGTNIIVDDECAKLEITDGANITIPEGKVSPFIKAAEAAYKRSLTSTSLWGTLYLPFEIKSNDDVQLYQITGAGVDYNTFESYLSFEKVDKVDASTPCLFKRKDTATNLDLESSNVDIKATGSPATANFYGTDINLIGTFEGTTIKSYEDNSNSDNDIGRFYIAKDQFWCAMQEATIPAFRAYVEMTSSGSSPAKSFSIFVDEDDNTPTEILKVGADGELYEVGNTEIYNLNGQHLRAPQKGQVNIINGKKVMIK